MGLDQDPGNRGPNLERLAGCKFLLNNRIGFPKDFEVSAIRRDCESSREAEGERT